MASPRLSFLVLALLDPDTGMATGSYTDTVNGDGVTTTNTWSWNLTLQGAPPPPLR